jgi:hypothetical protein
MGAGGRDNSTAFGRGRLAALRMSPHVSLIELLVVSALLAVLAVAVFGRHVADGGLYGDDWANLAVYEFADSPRYVSSVDEFADRLGSRPLLAALLPLPHALFGGEASGQLALALLLGLLTCVCFYLFLRAIPLAPLHAGVIAGLALIFPWADSIRLWATASLNTVALCFAFLGAFIALRGIESDGRRRTAALIGSSALYALSVLTYEVASVALLLVGVLYVLRVPRATALRWWGVHAGVVTAALVYTAATTVKDVGSVGNRLADIPSYSRSALAIFSLSFVPPGTMHTAPRAAAIFLLVGIVGFAAWRWYVSRDARLGFWLAFVAGSAIAVGSAYAFTLGAYLDPILAGLFNRGNIFAAFGMVAVIYGVAMLAGQLLRDRRLLGVVIVGASISLVAAGYAVRVSDDIDAWDEAARLQKPVIRNATRAARAGLPNSMILTFGYPAQVDGGVSIFDVHWDLDGALRVSTGGRVRDAFPIHERSRLSCGPRAMTISYPEIGDTVFVGYRATYFVDGRTGRSERVASRADCLSAGTRFQPGSWQVPPGFEA